MPDIQPHELLGDEPPKTTADLFDWRAAYVVEAAVSRSLKATIEFAIMTIEEEMTDEHTLELLKESFQERLHECAEHRRKYPQPGRI